MGGPGSLSQTPKNFFTRTAPNRGGNGGEFPPIFWRPKNFPPISPPPRSESSEVFPPHIFSFLRQFYLVLDLRIAFPKRRKA